MLRYFRINDPYRLLGLLLIMMVMGIPTLVNWPGLTHTELASFLVGEKLNDGFRLYSEVVDNTPPLAAWFYQACDFLFGRTMWIRHATAFLMIYIISCMVGFIFINRRAFEENTYVPSLVCGLLLFLSFDTLVLSADLLQLIFLLLALNNLIKVVEFREQRDETIFSLGFFLGLASLCQAFAVFNVAGTLLVLALFTRASIRYHLLMLFGFLLPHLFLVTLAYGRGTLDDFIFYAYLKNFADTAGSYLPWQNYFLLGAVPIFFIVISLFIVNKDARTTKYQAQVLQVMFIWMIFSLLQIFFTPALKPQSFIILAPSFTFFITHFFLLLKQRRWIFINTWLLILGVAGTHYLVRYQYMGSIDIQQLLVPESDYRVDDVLVLSENKAMYRHVEAGSPFVNWTFAGPVFKESDVYENILRIEAAFQKELPKAIYDPQRLMPAVFDRIPWLEEKYKHTPEGYVLAKAN